MAPPVFKTGLAANIVAGGFDSLPPPPVYFCAAGGKEQIASSDRHLGAVEAGEGEPGVVLVIQMRLIP